jgi:hypothetical protein
MPVIINDLEIVAEPAAGAGEARGAANPASGETESAAAPPVSPLVIREILERDTDRLMRTFAH